MHDKPYRIAKHSKISRMMFSDGNFWDSGLHPLTDKANKTTQDIKTLSLLIQAEQAAEKAQEARAKVMNLIQAEKRAEAKAARKARDHALYQSAGLLILAGLVDSQTGKPVDDAAALLGALASLNDLSRDNPKWSDWKIRGQELLNSKK